MNGHANGHAPNKGLNRAAEVEDVSRLTTANPSMPPPN